MDDGRKIEGHGNMYFMYLGIYLKCNYGCENLFSQVKERI